ncbi:MAG: hypothetical protein MK116_03785 [Phycisphaerales bacterium]|nr:hypothetical protein [Phycisphaerales bacterium]
MRLIVILVLFILVGCQAPASRDGRPVILDRSDHLDHHVGELVTIQGTVSRTRIPQIIGVDVGEGSDLAGQYAEATGVLFCWTVTPEAHASMQVMGNLVATRGPGTYYSLVSPMVLAPVTPLLDSPAGPLGDAEMDDATGEMIEIESITVEESAE